jgi:hypothetical protein
MQPNKIKILHIGNVANNAYNNAKMLNKHGYINHVLVADYSHIMGCPEWEELDIQPGTINDYQPDWTSIPHNFSRPNWFVQGGLLDCLDYLAILNNKKEDNQSRRQYWAYLSFKNRTKKKNLYYYFLWIKFRLIKSVTKRLKKALAFKNLPHSVNRSLIEDLISDFEYYFPHREDKLTKADFPYSLPPFQLLEILKKYDFVFCYGTDSILPMTVGFSDYVAFEHGTIRTLPWEKTTEGRLTALAYAKSKSILMTNADSIIQALKLNKNIFFGQHGFIINESAKKISPYSSTSIIKTIGLQTSRRILIFQPTRQDWKIKGNNRFLEAVARLKREHFDDFEIIFVDWGKDTAQTKQFLLENNLQNQAHWISPLSKPQLLKMYTEVDVLIDQFNIHCIGSTPLEIFSVKGAPLITSIDDTIMKKFYGKTIPLLNCKETEGIYNKLKEIITGKTNLNQIKEECYQWLLETHSEDKIINNLIQSQTFHIKI